MILDALDTSGLGLRLALVWHGDRYAHTISLVDGPRAMPWLTSREGSDQQLWPPSPPLQQFTLEQRPPNRSVALLLGMAGKSHWSLSIEADGANRRLAFDVACRVQQPTGRLCSSYRALVAPLSGRQGSCTLFQVAGFACRLQINTARAETASVLESADRHVSVVAQRPVTLPATVRWQYWVEVKIPTAGP